MKQHNKIKMTFEQASYIVSTIPTTQNTTISLITIFFWFFFSFCRAKQAKRHLGWWTKQARTSPTRHDGRRVVSELPSRHVSQPNMTRIVAGLKWAVPTWARPGHPFGKHYSSGRLYSKGTKVIFSLNPGKYLTTVDRWFTFTCPFICSFSRIHVVSIASGWTRAAVKAKRPPIAGTLHAYHASIGSRFRR